MMNMTNPEHNDPSRQTDKITSLGVDREGHIVIVTETTDGGYETRPAERDLNEAIGLFRESARLAELDPDHQHDRHGVGVDEELADGPDLDKIREEIKRLDPNYKEPYNEFENPDID